MADRRLTNSELHLQKLAEEEEQTADERGILEIFDRDEDEPLSRESADS